MRPVRYEEKVRLPPIEWDDPDIRERILNLQKQSELPLKFQETLHPRQL